MRTEPRAAGPHAPQAVCAAVNRDRLLDTAVRLVAKPSPTGSARAAAVRVLDLKTGTIDRVKGLPGGRSVAVDSKGNVYVGGGTTLRVMRPDGTVEVLDDSKKAVADEVKLGDNPKHLGFDADENVLIADDFGHQIKKFVVADRKLVVVAGSGKKGKAGLDGPPLAAELDGPHAVYFHPATKAIYIGDSRNKRVLKIEP
jgi:DNA-binding beta-propeller fold protein YncE